MLILVNPRRKRMTMTGTAEGIRRTTPSGTTELLTTGNNQSRHRVARGGLGAVDVLRFAVPLLLSLVVVRTALAQEHPPLAIIVHSGNRLTSLSLDELRRLYLGMTPTFPSGERVVLLESAEHRLPFYREALGMSEDQFKRHWIARVFAGEPGTPPESFRDPGELVRYVAQHPDAIGFLPANRVDGSVKLLTIDARRPSNLRYPLP
jgi:hypothetical protein